MKALSYTQNKNLPGIILNKEIGKFEISGDTYPEDAIEFYEPIFQWLDEYLKNPLEKTVFDFKLIYFNTVSSKILVMIMMRLEELLDNGKEALVRWFYHKNDEDIKEAGEDFESMLNLEFKFISY